jgi:head-tail adaptor
MSAVHLNRNLRLLHPASIPDGAGGFSITWQEIGRLWAEVLPGSGREVGGEEITLSTVSYRITVRGAPVGSPQRPMPGQRLMEGTRAFEIVAVTERDASGHYLTCFAREELRT